MIINVLNVLRKEAEKNGAMGSEMVSVSVDEFDVIIDELPWWMFWEIDGTNVIISCEAEKLY